MKKKLLTIFAVLVLIVAMTATVVACNKNDDKTPKPPEPTPVVVNLNALATESFTAMSTGLQGLIEAALDTSKEKSYDATIFAKVKVGDNVDVDVKLRVAATFGTKNSGLLDVIVGGQSYFTLYAADNMVYVGEALTQESMNWFEIDAVKQAELLDKFFPKLLDIFSEENEEGKTLFQQVSNSTIYSVFGLLPMLGSMIFVTDQADGIVKEVLSDGTVKYTNNVTFSKIQELVPTLSGPLFNLDIKGMLDGLDSGIKSIINIACPIIFGGDLDALLDGTIDPEAAPAIQLNYASKDGKLTDLEIKYANDFTFGDSKEATPISVAFGFESVEVTSDSKTAITTSAIDAGVKAAKEPAIKLTIDAAVPGKNAGGTVEAYVIPKVSVVVNEYAVVTEGEGDKAVTKHVKLVDGKHDGCLGDKCEHFYKIDTVDMGTAEKGAKAYALAKDLKGNVVNLGCDVDVSGLADGTIVLKIELAELYTLLGVEEVTGLPTQFQKTVQLWGGDDEKEPEVSEDENAKEPETPATPEGEEKPKEETKLPDNLIDAVIAIVKDFSIGKVLDLLDPALDFVKGIYNDALKDNLKSEEGSKVATIDVAAILKALVKNDVILKSETLNINKEGNITKYLTSLQGVADLVDNIMRHTDPNKKDVEKGKAYTKEELVALVKEYAGIDITDAAFNNTTLELTGIRGDKTKDEGLGFKAELKSEGKTVLTLTMTVDFVDAAGVPKQTVIGDDFAGKELEKVEVQDTNEDGTPKVDENGEPVMIEVDGQALNDINKLMKDLLDAYRGVKKAA